MRKGDHLKLVIGALDDEAAGVAVVDGVRVHVAGALPDEELDATVAHVSPHRPDAWAAIGAIARASPARVAPVCPAYGACGGCTLEHMAYAAQLEWKRDHVAAALARAGVGAGVAACVPSPRPLGYRNKSKLVYAEPAGEGGGVPVLGAYAPRSHRVIDLAGCRVAEAPLDDVAAALRDELARHGVRGYDERSGEGLLRYAILRVNHLGQVLVTLVTADDAFAAGEAIARALITARPEVAGVVQNINRSRGNALYGDAERVLAGASHLPDRVGTVELRLSSTAFFQVNRDVAARIYADVAEAAALTGTERVVDAYAGVGGIALTLARGAAEVVGIEEHARAVADAQASAQLNHATRVRFVVGDVEAELGKLGAADVVVLNPPRRGCVQPVLRAAAALRPRMIVYVSCAPDTLARDLALLGNDGFVARSVVPYDMLPQTPHVESLAILTPA
ncbi:MAG TPA: 23S rRNA (uracil(1939)-C(5))-methyltransferase RlmD [Polyangia bacterium]